VAWRIAGTYVGAAHATWLCLSGGRSAEQPGRRHRMQRCRRISHSRRQLGQPRLVQRQLRALQLLAFQPVGRQLESRVVVDDAASDEQTQVASSTPPPARSSAN
jgi:hypothetical protein